MAKTRHIQARCSQRGIRQSFLWLIQEFGEEPCGNGEKIVFNRKAIEQVINLLNKLKKDLMTAHSRGGYIEVVNGETQITVYALDSFKRK